MAKNSKKPAVDASGTTVKEVPGHTTRYDYVLQWIKESTEARRAQNLLVERAVMAYETKPSINRYKKSINAYADGVYRHDQVRAAQIKEACSDVPEKGSMAVNDAVETIVSGAMGGVGQYEFGPYDPDTKHDDKTMDRLSAGAKSFYNSNKVDAIIPQYIRNAVLTGAGYLHVKQKNKKKVITLLETSQMLMDPKRFKTNFDRFIGFHQRESFRVVKDRTKKIKGGGYVLKTLNEAEVYVTQIKQEMNNVLQSESTNEYLHDELRRDLDLFYKPMITQMKEGKETGDPALMYDGDEIEVSYIYDQMDNMYFEVINRRYITVAKKNPLTRDIKCQFYDAEGKTQTKVKTITLDHPFVELPYNKLFWSTYPVSPLFYVLDDFDELCAQESVLSHTLSIMAPLTFVGQSSDAEKVSRVASVSGEVVEGLPQTFGVLDKSHDISPTVTAIQRNEEKIKRALKAVDPFQLQGMIGDRATAKEVASASGQVAQGLNPFIANIETAMATLGETFMKLELIMNDEDTYSFSHNGKYVELSREEMAGGYEVTAKLVSSIKLEQEANSRKAIELVQYLADNEAVDKKEFLGVLIPIVLGNLVNREQAHRMVKEAYRPMPDEIIAAIKKKAEEESKKDAADKLNLDGYDDAALDQLLTEFPIDEGEEFDELAQGGEVPPTDPMTQIPTDPTTGLPVDPATGQPIMPTDPSIAAGVPGGVMPAAVPGSAEAAGVVANDPAGQAYVG